MDNYGDSDNVLVIFHAFCRYPFSMLTDWLLSGLSGCMKHDEAKGC